MSFFAHCLLPLAFGRFVFVPRDLFLFFNLNFFFIAFFIIIKIKIKSWARYINKGQYSRVVIL